MNYHHVTSSGHQIYPKRYFDASPTWFQWNKLTAADVHALREEPGFEGQNIYFHLNHPIRFVRLVGVVVEIDITPGAKHILISLDDSSGACIEIKTSFRNVNEHDRTEYPSNTLVDSLDVIVKLGHPIVLINKQRVELGTVINVKARLDSFRKQRQLVPELLRIVGSTNKETKAWSETAEWKRDVLSKPWVLRQEQRDAVDAEIKRAADKERIVNRTRKKYDDRRAKKKERHLEKLESRRKRWDITLNAGALVGSNVLPGRGTDP